MRLMIPNPECLEGKWKKDGFSPGDYVYWDGQQFMFHSGLGFDRHIRELNPADDWQLIPEPPRTMVFVEAVQTAYECVSINAHGFLATDWLVEGRA